MVTGSKVSDDLPGVFLKRQGDFLLMEISIESDSREPSVRRQEIRETVDALLALAKQRQDISVSIDANGLIYPLLSSQNMPLVSGRRPDTSVAQIILRTPIPEKVKDVQELATRLNSFANSVKGVGRATVLVDGDTTVSVVNPHQYRKDVIAVVLDEVAQVTKRLGPDYRVVIKGLDQSMDWRNTDDISVIFFIPYSYEIIPTSLTAKIEIPEY